MKGCLFSLLALWLLGSLLACSRMADTPVGGDWHVWGIYDFAQVGDRKLAILAVTDESGNLLGYDVYADGESLGALLGELRGADGGWTAADLEANAGLRYADANGDGFVDIGLPNRTGALLWYLWDGDGYVYAAGEREAVIPTEAIRSYAGEDAPDVLYYYGVVRWEGAYYVRVRETDTEAPGEYLYAPLAEALYASFQPEGLLGAWDPREYTSPEEMMAEDAEIPLGTAFRYVITDGRMDVLEERNPYGGSSAMGVLDLEAKDVPALLPDVLSLRERSYEELPLLTTPMEVNTYALWNFLWGRTGFECYLPRELVPDEGAGYRILSDACSAMAAYYLFSAYTEHDMYTEDRGDREGVYAKVQLHFVAEEWDLEARAEAMEYVLNNPVPEGGFANAAAEREYARGIHDFLAEKVSYALIGYDPEAMFGLNRYLSKQEAYTCLGEDQHSTVCAGYARGFALIAHYAGIHAAWVWGNKTETDSHAWNVLYPCDGSEPVLIDVTWDDTDQVDETGQAVIDYTWFYVPLSQVWDHTPDEAMEAFLAHLNGKPA